MSKTTNGTTPGTILAELETASPFGGLGRLSKDHRAALLAFADDDLGRAISLLVGHAAALPPAAASGAADEIASLVDAGEIERLREGLDPAGLVGAFAAIRRDASRQALTDLVVRLLRTLEPDDILATVGIDARSLDLRAELSGLFAQAAMAEPPGGGTRGIDFDAFEPAAGEAGGEGDAGPEGGVGDLGAMPEPAMGMGLDEGDGGAFEAALPTAAPPAAAAGGGPAVSSTYRAYGLLESDEAVLVGRAFDLRVGLSPRPSAGVAGAALVLPDPTARAYTVDVQLFADGFDLGPGQTWRVQLAVSAAERFPQVTLALTARPIPTARAVRSITATFSIDGETLGAATRELAVTTDATELAGPAPVPTAAGTNITAPTGAPPADITITIKRGIERGTLLWGVESRLPGVNLPHDQPAMSDIGDEPKAFAMAIILKLYAKGHRRGVFQLLQGIGKRVRGKIPPTVRDAIAAANGAVAPRPLDILLLTEEPYVPWELALVDPPFDKNAPPYLGAQANIGRWVLDGGETPTDPPRTVNASSMAVVWGVYDRVSTLQRLKAAEAEAESIVATWHATSISAENDPVVDVLGGTPPADILHFAVHGRYNPDNVQEGIFMLDGSTIDDFTVAGSDLRERSPFVFLNACQVGAAQNVLGSYAGIAQSFLQIGASAVVAPLWSVDDTIAREIALDFYTRALAPTAAGDTERPTVADLLRQARGGLVRNAAAQSSTYLAYQFYGHPSLRLTWQPDPGAGG